MKKYLLIILFLVLTVSVNAQKETALEYLNKVKSYYGETCFIGVPTVLIKGLQTYKDKDCLAYYESYKLINEYLVECKNNYVSKNNNMVYFMSNPKNKAWSNIVNYIYIAYGSTSSKLLDFVLGSNKYKYFFIKENKIELPIIDNEEYYLSVLKDSGSEFWNSSKLIKLANTPY